MDSVALSDAPWRHVSAAGLAGLGLALVWRGLRGGRVQT